MNTISAQTLHNGSRSVVVQYNISADGSGDYSDYPLFDLSDYTGEDYHKTPNSIAVRSVSGTSPSGATYNLKFGSISGNHELFYTSTINNDAQTVWGGGHPNLVQDTDNKILISTTDFDSSGLEMTVVLEIKKKFRSETA